MPTMQEKEGKERKQERPLALIIKTKFIFAFQIMYRKRNGRIATFCKSVLKAFFPA